MKLQVQAIKDQLHEETEAIPKAKHYTSSDTCFSAFKASLDPSTTLGGFSGNNYFEASAFVVIYPVTNAIDEAKDGNGKTMAWEKAFIQLAKVKVQSVSNILIL
ncbi:hypothetical protein REPUB_Repub03eG0138700 [Reevesia pubescens]